MTQFGDVQIRHTIENSTNMKEVFDFVLQQQYKKQPVFRYVRNSEVIVVDGEQFLHELRGLAFWIQQRGYKRAHLGIVSSNRYEYLLLYTAIVYSGNVAVLISKDSNESQIYDECKLADVDAVFVENPFAEKVNSACSRLSISVYDLDKAVDEMSSAPAMGNVENSTEREDLISIFFTSGTTGKSKAVAMSNRSMFSVMLSPTYPYDGQLIVLPMHHVAAMTMYLSALGVIRETHISSGVEYFIRDLKLLQTDVTLVVPMLLKILLVRLKNAGWDQKKLGWNLRTLACAGAAFPPEVIEDCNKAGILITQFYGMTETGGGGLYSLMTPENRFSVGNKVLYGHEVDIIDGELVIKSCRQMLGYYKDPEETNKVFYDGWMHTGDLARKDEEGYYYLVGRKKNLIILSNGENVSPEEIERKINMCEDIAESLVYGDHKFLHICVYPNMEGIESEQAEKEMQERIRGYVRQYNADAPTYKQIRFVEFRNSPFERNAVGKIVRDGISE